jgi:hypothetical protein
MKVFSDFHAIGKFEKSLIASFIILILKLHGAIDLKDFWPISLVGGIYKIIVKILANRLRMVMEKIISKSPSAFVRVRQILNLVLIAKCLDSRLRFGQLSVIRKMDLEKAYDHVNWNFWLYLLRWCGFGENWCS